MKSSNFILKLWQKLANKPGGKWFFSKAIARRVPYFKTIQPLFVDLSTTRCEITAPLRRSVTNHLGSFHAIAMCNMAEAAMGILAEAAVPAKTHRWIPKGMTVEYLKIARTDLRAVATLDPAQQYGKTGFDLVVPVQVYDRKDQLVFRADIRLWVSPKK